MRRATGIALAASIAAGSFPVAVAALAGVAPGAVGHVLTLRPLAVPVRIDGRVAAIDASGIVVIDRGAPQRIDFDVHTGVWQAGRRRATGDLQAGDRVRVDASATNGTVTARRIMRLQR
jgi:hypothetical protein